MIIPLFDTTINEVADKLVSIRLEGGVIALSRVLTLLVPVGAAAAEEAIEAANKSSMEHPCRLIVLIEGDPTGKSALDAEIRVGGDAGASEVVVLRLRGQMIDQQASLVVPLLLPDVPVVTWWPDRVPDVPASTSLGTVAERRVTDSRMAEGSLVERLTRLSHGYRPGDTDLAWTSLTWWRAHLASLLDQPPFERVTRVVVVGRTEHPTPVLLATWLGWKLHCPAEVEAVESTATLRRVELHRASGVISIDRPQGTSAATLTMPSGQVRRFQLPPPSLSDCLSEELRRLDADTVYGEVVKRGLAWLQHGDHLTDASQVED
ncbi:MAG: glucose-6-phosphate dehydrogenase assembly protein OpcA [Propionibacteriaceae bacterium]|nr:glucose-6-phosphate dehydrogenase assembly protein OpcA [Propionibacteriaceae bacterium]